MKSILRLMALTVILLPLLAACGSKTETNSGSKSEKTETAAPATLDMQRITDISKKNSDEITSSDFDFLIDQMEIVMKPTKNMTSEQRKEYMGNLDSDTQGAIIIVGLAIQAASEKGMLSDKQLKRMAEMEKKYDNDEK